MSDLAVPERRRLSVSRRQRSDAARGFPVPTSPVVSLCRGDGEAKPLEDFRPLYPTYQHRMSRRRTSYQVRGVRSGGSN